MIKVLIQRLKELGIHEDTLVIFTSDHGEAFYEHNNFLHNDTFGETLHVPLIIVYPKGIPKNIKIRQLVRLTDIMPTILDILGIKTEIFMQGKSLLPVIYGRNETLSCYSSFEDFKSIRTESYAYVETGSYGVLYDRVEDPEEKYDIAAHKQRVAKELKRRAYAEHQNSQRQATLLNQSREEEVIIDTETLQKLKSLGYM
jgi:arylsulfatase A-like enzyme